MIDIAAKGVSAAKWGAGSTAGRFALQLGAQVVLARVLGPATYGIFGLGLVVFTFSNFLAIFGFGWALMQLVELREEDVRFSFTWQLVAGAAAGVALYFAAPFLATYFHDLRVLPVMRWLSLACVLNAAASPASNLLSRDMNFRALGLIDVASYALGYIGVGIPLALAGAGVYSLVAAWLVQSGVKMGASFLMRPHSLRPLFWYDGAPVIFSMGSTVFATNLVNWFLNNLDSLIIGRLLNVRAVGLYNVGYNLANTPNSLLLGALQPAFFAAGARLQNDSQRLGKAYLQVVSTIWVLVAPAFVFLSIIAVDLVRFVYGPRWIEAGAVLSILFLAMPIYVTWGMSTPVLWNTGRKSYESLLQLPILLIAVVAFYRFAPMGIRAASLVAAGLLVARGLVVGTAAFRAVGLHVRDLFPHLLRSALLSSVTAAGALLGQHIVSRIGIPLLSLASASVVAPLVVLAVVWTWPAVLGDHTAAMVVRFVPKLRIFLGVPDAAPIH